MEALPMPHPVPPTTSAFLCLINHHQQFNVLNYFLQNDTPWCHISSMNFTAKLLGGFSVRWPTVLLYRSLCSFTPRGPLELLTQDTNGLHESQLIRKPGFAYYCCLCDLEPVSHFFLTLLLGVSWISPSSSYPLCLFGNISFLVVEYRGTNVYAPVLYLSSLIPGGLTVAP